MNCVVEIVQKIIDNGADEIKHKTEDKLNMCYGRSPMSYGVIDSGETSFWTPAAKGTENSKK